MLQLRVIYFIALGSIALFIAGLAGVAAALADWPHKDAAITTAITAGVIWFICTVLVLVGTAHRDE